MTPAEFTSAMRELRLKSQEDKDKEAVYQAALNLLCYVLNRCGYAAGVEEFKKIERHA